MPTKGKDAMSGPYLYRREDSGEVIELPWPAPIEQDAAGFLVLPDGAVAKRCLHLELARDGRPQRACQGEIVDREVVSDTLGFGRHQLQEMRDHLAREGVRGVEFVPDPKVPEFMRVKCSSRRAYDKYAKSRGFTNRTGIGGVRLTQEDLDRAAQLHMRRAKPK